jgi:hypothetical protein
MCFPDKYYENYKYLSNDIFVFFNIDFDMSAQHRRPYKPPATEFSRATNLTTSLPATAAPAGMA